MSATLKQKPAVQFGQMAIIGKISVGKFVNATFNFPTMAEAYRIAALEIIHARDWKAGPDDADGRHVFRLQPVPNACYATRGWHWLV